MRKQMTTPIVLTGGPGAGKTAVIEHIAHLGFRCCQEVGRQVIQSQVEQGGKAVPWQDKAAFRDRMLFAEQANLARVADHEGTVFFDRGLVDVYGYSRLEGLTVPPSLVSACEAHRYHDPVFLFPPWKAIFTNDKERKQSFAEAVATFEIMQTAYRHFGYTPMEVPRAPVHIRAEFILDRVIR